MKWKNRSSSEKLLRITELMISVIIIVSAVLRYRNIWPDGLSLAIPLLGVLQLIQAVLYWKNDRDQAAISLFCACFIGIVCIGVFFI